VERNGRHFEPEPHEEQAEADRSIDCRPAPASGPARDWLRFVVAVAPYTSAIPYSRKPDAKRSQEEVLEPRFRGGGAVAIDAGQGVHRHGHELEPEDTTIKSSPPTMEHRANVAKQQQA